MKVSLVELIAVGNFLINLMRLALDVDEHRDHWNQIG